jgi:hypothetical protein
MLQPKKPLKQLIQNAFKKGTEKSANDNATRYRVPPATVSKPSTSTPKGQNVPMGSGSKSKEYKSFDDMPRMKMKSSSKYKSEK